MQPHIIAVDPAITPLDAWRCFENTSEAVLLHSATTEHPLGRYSYFAADPITTIVADAECWPEVAARIRATFHPVKVLPGVPPMQGGWIGWIGYEAGRAFTRQPRHTAGPAPTRDIVLGLFDWVLAWDHAAGTTWLVSTGLDATGNRDAGRGVRRAGKVRRRLRIPAAMPGQLNGDAVIRPDCAHHEFCAAVGRVVDHIRAGDIFQANLAQRFVVPFGGDPADLYSNICARTAAPMAALIRQGDVVIASASPERFVRLDASTREVETRPIKGTRRRDADPGSDAALAVELTNSAKDRAENVMIVDVLRNDLSRVCEPGSLSVPTLCAIESHPTVHHMVSTVTGRLRSGRDALDLLAATFPGGSITGAPKIRAMEIIASLEPVARGVYTGAILWIGLDGSMDSSVAIRTVTVTGSVAMVYAGGGVTALSEPEAEYQETIDKARALLDAFEQRQ
ncbi:MAG: aminodeoxychorismate synthase component I [Gemmatimonadales bacterium]